MEFPIDFRRNIVSIFGSKAVDWLDNFPVLLERILKHWQLILVENLPNLSINYLALVKTSDNKKAVLKTGVPNPELYTEMAALKIFNGKILVKCLEQSQEMGAYLMELISPGSTLNRYLDETQQTVIAAEIISDLPQAIEDKNEFPSVKKWLERAFDKAGSSVNPDYDPFRSGFITPAREFLAELNLTEDHLLHGDLHHENILRSDEYGWKVIDPKGVIGDARFECGRYMHNQLNPILDDRELKSILQLRAEIFAEKYECRVIDILQIAFIDCVLSNLWTVEDKYGNLAQGLRHCRLLLELIEGDR